MDNLISAAKDQNLLRATDAYTQVARSCVECHKLFRREQFLKSQTDGTFKSPFPLVADHAMILSVGNLLAGAARLVRGLRWNLILFRPLRRFAGIGHASTWEKLRHRKSAGALSPGNPHRVV